jgi:hypothetical protein
VVSKETRCGPSLASSSRSCAAALQKPSPLPYPSPPRPPGASSLTLDTPPTTLSLPGATHPTTYTPLTCAGCGAALGRRYAPGPGLPASLAPFAGLFALDVAALASYELGAPALVARAPLDGGCVAGPAAPPPVDSAGGGGGAPACDGGGLASRVAALEEEVMRIQAFLLDTHTAAAAASGGGGGGVGVRPG